MNTKILFFKNYLVLIQNSVGAKMYKNFYIQAGEHDVDITQDGYLSCAYYVTSVLKFFDLITALHITVDGTLKDMSTFGWYPIGTPQKGCVIVWHPNEGYKHRHIGFYIGDNLAVSNDSVKKCPKEHDLQLGKYKRKVEQFLWHKRLDPTFS